MFDIGMMLSPLATPLGAFSAWVARAVELVENELMTDVEAGLKGAVRGASRCVVEADVERKVEARGRAGQLIRRRTCILLIFECL